MSKRKVEAVDDVAVTEKPRKPRKATSMGEVRVCDVWINGKSQNALPPIPDGATVLILHPADKYEPRPDAKGAMKLIAGMEGDHAVIRLVGAASVKAEKVERLVQSPLAL